MTELSTTEWLITDVLAARYRLGEQLWTFPERPKIKKALRGLEGKGLVFVMHGITELTMRAGLTEEGIETFLSVNYEPPIKGRPA